MDSDDEEPIQPVQPIQPTRLLDVIEPLQDYLNLGELMRLQMTNYEFQNEVNAVVGWKSRAVALKCKRQKIYNRYTVSNYIRNTKTRCGECGGKSARTYKKIFHVCNSCRSECRGFRQLVSRNDIRRSFDLTPYKVLQLTRRLKPLQGGNGLHPYLYWGCDVNREISHLDERPWGFRVRREIT